MKSKSEKNDNSKLVSKEQLDFGDLDDMIGIIVQRSFHTATKFFRKFMGPDFKPGFYTSLSLIEKNPGLTQKSLAKAIRRDTSTLVPFLDNMEKNGLAVRKRSTTDRRAHGLYLTKSGFKTAKHYDEKVRDLEAKIAKKMGARDMTQLKKLLRKFENVFKTL